jgi:hypothetical protein
MMRLLRFLPILALLPALHAEPAKVAKLTFLRSTEDSLQTLSAEYKPADGKGPDVWLIGVAHLGTREYYDKIQKRLDAQSAVLYEGVGGDKLKEGAKSEAGIQTQLANALGLLFQLDAIDYKRAHFINSDLTVEKLNDAVSKRAAITAAAGGNGPTPATKTDSPAAPSEKSGTSTVPAKPVEKVDNATFDSLMGAIRGEGELAESLSGMIGLMGSTPEMRETTKLMLVQALGQAGEIIEVAKKASPELKDLFDVLLTERNAEVLRQLDGQISRLKPGQSVAVFFGAAHMDEIAEKLTSQLHYTQAKQEWDTAFQADATKSFMPPAQIKMMIQMMQSQLQNPNAAGGDALGGSPLLNLFGAPPAATPPAKTATPKPAGRK